MKKYRIYKVESFNSYECRYKDDFNDDVIVNVYVLDAQHNLLQFRSHRDRFRKNICEVPLNRKFICETDDRESIKTTIELLLKIEKL